MKEEFKKAGRHLDTIICHHCSICNKRIDGLVYDFKEYVYKKEYKHKRYFFCSWTCMRQFEKENNIE